MRRLSVDITLGQLAAIDALCKRWSCTRSQLLERALREYIAKERGIFAIDQEIARSMPI